MYDKAIKDMEANTGIYDFVYIEQDIIYSYLSRDFLVDITQSLKDNPKLAVARLQGRELHHLHRLLQGRRTATSYGVPMEAFVKVYLYRKDLFDDPKAQEAFKAKYGRDLAPAKTHQEYRDIAEFFTQWGKDNGQELWGTTVQAHTGHPASWYEFFESVAPTFGVYNWGINAEKNYARLGRQRRPMNSRQGQGGARMLARPPRIRAAGIDAEHLGRGRGDLRRRPRRAGPGLRRERRLDRHQRRQVARSSARSASPCRRSTTA